MSKARFEIGDIIYRIKTRSIGDDTKPYPVINVRRCPESKRRRGIMCEKEENKSCDGHQYCRSAGTNRPWRELWYCGCGFEKKEPLICKLTTRKFKIYE